jgi:SAM-dependent methyltransferase
MFGGIASDEQSVFRTFTNRFAMAGRAVVEIGGAVPVALVRAAQIKQWVAVDPRNSPQGGPQTEYWSLRGRGSQLPLDTGTVDFVFSCNAFEHIADLNATLEELARVLKVGGIVYAHFGPIWSAPDGHHLETVVDGEAYNFWEDQTVPLWAHLALTQEELTLVLEKLRPKSVAASLARWIHQDEELNRLFFEDYLDLFAKSSLHLVHLETCADIDYAGGIPAKPNDLHALARRKVGAHRDLFTRDVMAILMKR